MTDKQEKEMINDLLPIIESISMSSEEEIVHRNCVTEISDKVKFLQEHNSYLGKTKEFMLSFNQIVNEKPVKPNRDLIKLRLSLLLEELIELAEACGNESLCDLQRMLFERSEFVHRLTEAGRELTKYNEVEIFDALIDLQYVIIGCAIENGLHTKLDTCFDEVHASNMSKLGPDGKPIHRQSDGKVLKGPNFFKPKLKEIINNEYR